MQLMVIIMVAGDFLAMSLTTDNVRLGTQALATLIAVYGLLMTPLGWAGRFSFWGYAVAWLLATDPVKLLAEPAAKAGSPPDVSVATPQIAT